MKGVVLALRAPVHRNQRSDSACLGSGTMVSESE